MRGIAIGPLDRLGATVVQCGHLVVLEAERTLLGNRGSVANDPIPDLRSVHGDAKETSCPLGWRGICVTQQYSQPPEGDMNIYWKSAVSDNFATSTDWSTNSVPGNFDIAKMTVAGTYTITSTALTRVFGITTGPNTTLSIQSSDFVASEGTPTGANSGIIDIGNGASFQCGGAVNNVGHIVLNASGTPTDFGANILEGGGDVSLSDDLNNLVGVGTNVDNTISGAGTINGPMNNQALGVIIASGTNPLKLTGTISNAGLLTASGGTLEIDADVTNTASGVIEAVPGSTVDLGLT